MAKQEEKFTVGVVIKIDESLDLELQQHILELRKIGVKTTKANLAIKLIRIGLAEEKKTINYD